MARRDSSRGQRRTALILAALWLVVPALSAVHSVEQSHRYCNEHRAFEHGEQLGVGTPTRDSAATAAATAATIASTDASIAALHEECAFSASILREATTPCGASVAAAAMLTDLPQATSRDSQTHAPQLALLRVSPKSSPPTRNSRSS